MVTELSFSSIQDLLHFSDLISVVSIFGDDLYDGQICMMQRVELDSHKANEIKALLSGKRISLTFLWNGLLNAIGCCCGNYNNIAAVGQSALGKYALVAAVQMFLD